MADQNEINPNEGAEAVITADMPQAEADAGAPDMAGDQLDALEAQAGPAESSGPEVAFSWEASEYVHHHKSAMWYVALFGIVVVLIGLAVWLKLWLEIGLFVVMAVAVVVYARKPPRTMLYELSSEGVHIDGKAYPFEVFRSFAVIMDEEWHSVDLEPAKRFNPRLVLLYNPEDVNEIVGHLERHLPRIDREPDIIEKITRLVRF